MPIHGHGIAHTQVRNCSIKRSYLVTLENLQWISSIGNPQGLALISVGRVDRGTFTVTQDVKHIGNVRIPGVERGESCVNAGHLSDGNVIHARDQLAQTMSAFVERHAIVDFLIGRAEESAPDVEAHSAERWKLSNHGLVEALKLWSPIVQIGRRRQRRVSCY